MKRLTKQMRKEISLAEMLRRNEGMDIPGFTHVGNMKEKLKMPSWRKKTHFVKIL